MGVSMTDFVKKYKALLAVVITLISLSGAIMAVETRYAKAKDQKQIRVDLDYYVLSQRAQELQRRMWELEDRYKCQEQQMPEDAKRAHREYRLEREEILRKIEMIKRSK